MDCVNSNLDDLPCEIKKQLNIIDTSKFYVVLIIIGTLISLNALDLQKNQLICSALKGSECKCPQLLSSRVISSILIIISLIFFYNLSCKTATAAKGKNCSANLNLSASTFTLLAVLIRFIDIIANQCK